MAYEFLSERDAMDYLDAMYEDGERYEGLYLDPLRDDATVPANDLADEFCETWNEIELLPEYDGMTGDN